MCGPASRNRIEFRMNDHRTALIWFRNDLRVEDQSSILDAVRNHDRVVGYTAIPRSWLRTGPLGFPRMNRFRIRFLLESIADLRTMLDRLNISLVVGFDDDDSLGDLCREHGITDAYLQHEWTRDERYDESRIPEHVRVHRAWDQFLFHPDDIPMEVERVPEVFTQFRKACEKESTVRPCLPTPDPLPTGNRLPDLPPLPTLEALGVADEAPDPRSVVPFRGGASTGQDRIDHYFWRTRSLSNYKNTRNGLLGEDYSSKFSPWLAIGCLSPRRIYWEVMEYERTVGANQSTYWMVFELLWRDYFKYVSLKHGANLFRVGGIRRRSYEWSRDTDAFERWTQGRTGEPFVDANMNELRCTGFMSNRGRQNVASYLSKTMGIDWRWGAAYFESLLVDHDVHSNYGNWNYNAGVGNDPRDRTFDVAWQAERYDRDGTYRRTWAGPAG